MISKIQLMYRILYALSVMHMAVHLYQILHHHQSLSLLISWVIQISSLSSSEYISSSDESLSLFSTVSNVLQSCLLFYSLFNCWVVLFQGRSYSYSITQNLLTETCQCKSTLNSTISRYNSIKKQCYFNVNKSPVSGIIQKYQFWPNICQKLMKSKLGSGNRIAI